LSWRCSLLQKGIPKDIGSGTSLILRVRQCDGQNMKSDEEKSRTIYKKKTRPKASLLDMTQKAP
tara:strand:+ start:17547 stop:17738 length:192 start_codon:yes stop_codon:yes gene_type:complete